MRCRIQLRWRILSIKPGLWSARSFSPACGSRLERLATCDPRGVHGRPAGFLCRSATLLLYCNDRTSRLGSRCRFRAPISARACSRESVPPEATSAVSGTEGQTTQGRRRHPLNDGNAEPNVCLPRCSVERETGYADPLAPKGVPPCSGDGNPDPPEDLAFQRTCVN